MAHLHLFPSTIAQTSVIVTGVDNSCGSDQTTPNAQEVAIVVQSVLGGVSWSLSTPDVLTQVAIKLKKNSRIGPIIPLAVFRIGQSNVMTSKEGKNRQLVIQSPSLAGLEA